MEEQKLAKHQMENQKTENEKEEPAKDTFIPLPFWYEKGRVAKEAPQCVDSDDEMGTVYEKENSLRSLYTEEFNEKYIKEAGLTPREIREIERRPIASFLKFTPKQIERRKAINKKLQLVAHKINQVDQRIIEAEEKYPSGELYRNTITGDLFVITSWKIDLKTQKIYAVMWPFREADPAILCLDSREPLTYFDFTSDLLSRRTAYQLFDPLGRWY